jgi:hypothetical protein
LNRYALDGMKSPDLVRRADRLVRAKSTPGNPMSG